MPKLRFRPECASIELCDSLGDIYEYHTHIVNGVKYVNGKVILAFLVLYSHFSICKACLCYMNKLS